MKWYGVLHYLNTVKYPLIADSEFLYGHLAWRFMQCSAVEEWGADAWFKASKPDNDGDLDDVLQNTCTLPVYSPRLQTMLEAEGITGIQFLPVKVFRPDQSSVSGYAIANILNSSKALDLQLSEYSVFSDTYFQEKRRGDIRGLDKPVLRLSELSTYDVVRLSNYQSPIYVSERFRRLFKKHGFTGIGFDEISTVYS